MIQDTVNKTLGLFIILLSMSLASAAQNYQVSGRVIDGDTKAPVDSVWMYFFKGLKFRSVATDSTGVFRLDGLKKGRYHIILDHPHYKTDQKMIVIRNSSVYRELEMFHESSANQSRTEDIANEDDYHGGFAVNFYNPGMEREFRSSVSIEYLYSFKRKISRFDQVGLEFIPVKFVWHKIGHETALTPEDYKSERYFGYYISAFAYNRVIITKQKKTGYPGLFADLGIGYELPLSFTYSYRDESDDKRRHRHIHQMNEFTGLLRLGFDVISLKATYRFTDILKNNYPEPPKFKIGIEFNIPRRYI